MTEPKRWIDDGPPEAIQHLLRAASSERPTEQSLSRTLTVLGVGVGASGAAATAGAATAAGGAAAAGGSVTAGGAAASGALGAASVKAATVVVTSGLLKWGAVVTVLAAAGVAGSVAIKHTAGASSNHPTMTAAPSAVVAPGRAEARLGVASAASAVAEARVSASATAPSASAAGPLENAAKSTATEAKDVRKSSRSVSSMPKSSSSVSGAPTIAEAPTVADAPPIDTEHLAEEVALVDRARGAFASGDAAGALTALDEYDARFARRKFAPEALYLRMESLLREGRAEAARGVAQSLTNSYPKSPHAARARQVLGQTIP